MLGFKRSNRVLSKVSNLYFSSAVSVSPRQVIIDNLNKLGKLSGVTHTEEELKALHRYVASTPTGSSDKFVKDPKAWQNMPASQFIMTESGREETWPFLVGGV